MTKKTFTAREAAEICRVSPSTVAKWCRRGKIKYHYEIPDTQRHKIPGTQSIRIRRDHLSDFMEQHGLSLDRLLRSEEDEVKPVPLDKDLDFRGPCRIMLDFESWRRLAAWFEAMRDANAFGAGLDTSLFVPTDSDIRRVVPGQRFLIKLAGDCQELAKSDDGTESTEGSN